MLDYDIISHTHQNQNHQHFPLGRHFHLNMESSLFSVLFYQIKHHSKVDKSYAWFKTSFIIIIIIIIIQIVIVIMIIIEQPSPLADFCLRPRGTFSSSERRSMTSHPIKTSWGNGFVFVLKLLNCHSYLRVICNKVVIKKKKD